MGIYTNQVGYYPTAVKHGTVTKAGVYRVVNSSNDTVLELNVSEQDLTFDDNSGEKCSSIDFSSVKTVGTYHIESEAGEKSCSFVISENAYDKLFSDSIRMFYFQRCGMALEEKYAGKFAHKICHIKPVSVLRNRADVFECNGGWHDAGDFGRYVTAGAVALAHLLYAFEMMPEKLSLDLNIPETGSGMPDILSECKYELDWMLKMQNAEGGVYHKCTSIKHADFIMPEDDDLDFFATPVSSMAVADFVAVCYLAARIYKKYDEQYSAKLSNAADKSWQWLLDNPEFLYDNDPSCTTGEYDDVNDLDERMWAAAERYRACKDEVAVSYINKQLVYRINTTSVGWWDVGGFASVAVLTAEDNLFPVDVVNRFKSDWTDEANRLREIITSNSYEISFRSHEFVWGSNMEILKNAVVLFIQAKRSGDSSYSDAAIHQLDYILGRNAVNFSYVTGHGENAFKNPHNRPTASDGVEEVIPGYVSGGANGHPCDEVACELIPEGTAPMKCFVDRVECYSLNEITIYWNSIFVWALAFAL